MSGALEKDQQGSRRQMFMNQTPACMSVFSSSPGVTPTDREARAFGMERRVMETPRSGIAWMGEGTEP